MPIRQRIRVPFDGHVIGQGFNSDTGERVGTGLTVAQVGEDQAADGQIATLRFHVVTSQQSMESSLNISAEIEARYLLFSGGAKFSFAEKNAVNSSSTYVVGSCEVMNATRVGRNFAPTTNADRLLQAGDTDGFKRAFGDRFCQALRTGGELYTVVRITSSSTSHQSKIAASLHAELNALAGAGSFKGAFDNAQADTSSHTEVDIAVFQMGGQGDQVQLPGAEADKIREQMNRFAASVHQHAVAYEAELVTYDTLALAMPPALELEDRRQILEDCQARKQKYWSAISELEYLQTDGAGLIFADLPPRADLLALQSEFRRVLSALMAHARGVSTGAIPPALFVPEREPVMPRFPRRNTTTFAVWWARRDEPELLADERTLVRKIGVAASSLLSTPLTDAPASGVQNAAALIETLDLSFLGEPFDVGVPLHSVAPLPRMIASPLQKIELQNNLLDDLGGIETFTRLEAINTEHNKLRDITVLAGLAGLRSLNLRQNEIEEIGALAGLNRLQSLFLDGNRIQSLEPLRGKTELSILILGASLPVSTVEGEPAPPPKITDNPIRDGRALASLPRLANPFIAADRLTVRLTLLPEAGGGPPLEVLNQLAAGQDAGTVIEGIATRLGDSTEFQFIPNGAGAAERMRFAGIVAGTEFDPVSWVGVLLRDRRKIGVAAAPTSTPRETLDRRAFAQRVLPNPFSLLPIALIGMPPEILVEARAL
jgi:hypothetical protein